MTSIPPNSSHQTTPGSDTTFQRSTRITVVHPEAIKALFDNRQRSMLAPFFGEPQTVNEAATVTDALPTTMFSFVRRMLKVGVLTNAGNVRRSGKMVRRYATIADELHIPIDQAEGVLMLPERRYQTLYNEAFEHEILRYHYEVEPIGAVVKRLPNGVVHITGRAGDGDWIPGANGPVLFYEWSMLALEPADAIAFRDELAALAKKFRARPFGTEPYYFGLHLAPVPPAHRANNSRQFVNVPKPT